jgi:hypothetical protein
MPDGYSGAFGQPFSGAPFSLATGAIPLPGDLVFGGSVSTGQSVSWTWAQIINATAIGGSGSNILPTNNTWTGTNAFNGTVGLNGGSISGSFSGSPTFTGNPAFSGTPSFSGTVSFVTLTASTINGIVIGHGAGTVSSNFAVGSGALVANTSGHDNVAIGTSALNISTTGAQNIAIGNSSLESLLTSANNIGIGFFALASVTGTQNIAIGTQAGSNITSGQGNLTLGYQSGNLITTGSFNTVLGSGGGSLTTGSNNVIIGGNDGSTIATLSNNILLSDGAGNIRLEYLTSKLGWSLPQATNGLGSGPALTITAGGANAGLSGGVINPALFIGNGGAALQGSVTSATPILGIFASITNDQVAASGGAGGTQGHLFGLSFGGSATGGRTGVSVSLKQTTTTANSGTSTFYTGLGLLAEGQANDNGTSGGSSGGLFGFNPIIQLDSSASWWHEICGIEVDVGVLNTSGPVKWKTGIKSNLWLGDATNGTEVDAAYTIGSGSTATVGWKAGWSIGGYGAALGRWPMDSAGVIMPIYACATGSNSCAGGVDMSQITLTSFFLKSTGFLVDGSGNVTAVSIGNSTTALEISGSGSWTANGSTVLALSNVGPSGAHATVQEWLTIKDASGTTRYIPAF